MRSTTLAAVAVAALLLAGCADRTVAGRGEPAGAVVAASSSGAAAGSSSAPASGAGAAQTSAQLQAVLLGIDDVGGSGWSAVPPDNTSDDSDDSDCGSGDLTDTANQAEADFTQGALGPFLAQLLMSAPSAAVAKIDYAKGIASFRACSGVKQPDGTTDTVTEMSFPKYGDQSEGFRITEVDSNPTSSPGDDSVDSSIPFPIDVVIVQDGRLVELYLYVALTASDPSSLQTAVKNGVTRAHLLH